MSQLILTSKHKHQETEILIMSKVVVNVIVNLLLMLAKKKK